MIEDPIRSAFEYIDDDAPDEFRDALHARLLAELVADHEIDGDGDDDVPLTSDDPRPRSGTRLLMAVAAVVALIGLGVIVLVSEQHADEEIDGNSVPPTLIDETSPTTIPTPTTPAPTTAPTAVTITAAPESSAPPSPVIPDPTDATAPQAALITPDEIGPGWAEFDTSSDANPPLSPDLLAEQCTESDPTALDDSRERPVTAWTELVGPLQPNTPTLQVVTIYPTEQAATAAMDLIGSPDFDGCVVSVLSERQPQRPDWSIRRNRWIRRNRVAERARRPSVRVDRARGEQPRGRPHSSPHLRTGRSRYRVHRGHGRACVRRRRRPGNDRTTKGRWSRRRGS